MHKFDKYKMLLSCLCTMMPSFVFADINTLYLQEGTAVLKGSSYNSRTLCSSWPFKQKYVGYVCKGSDGISLGKTVQETDIADKDYGLTFCQNGFWPNPDRTKCEKATDENSVVHNCEKGYMSWKVLNMGDTDECIKCTDENIKKVLSVLPDDLYPDKTVTNYYCNGGKYRQPHSGDDRVPRGLSKCLPVNNQISSKANSDHSGCVGTGTYYSGCPNGSRLSNDLTTCECMYGGNLSYDGTKCDGMAITKEDLKYGPDGSSTPLHKQCWTKTKPADYKKCMLFDK